VELREKNGSYGRKMGVRSTRSGRESAESQRALIDKERFVGWWWGINGYGE
jgi:hypothetical protein